MGLHRQLQLQFQEEQQRYRESLAQEYAWFRESEAQVFRAEYQHEVNYLHNVQSDERKQIEMQYAVCANDLEAFRKELESVRFTTMAQRQQVEAENQQLQQRYQQIEEAYVCERVLCQRVQHDIPGELEYYTAQLR